MVLSADIVHYVHILLMFGGMVVPFVGSYKTLNDYSLFVPFLMFHWCTNNDTCALTYVEKFLRGADTKEQTFVGQVMNKIYILPNDIWGLIIKTIYFLLWLFTQFKLGRVF